MDVLIVWYAVGVVAAVAVLVVFALDRSSRLSLALRILLLVIGWPFALAYVAFFATWWLVSLGGRRKPFDLV